MKTLDFLIEAILELKDVDAEDLQPSRPLQELALESLDYVEIQVLIKKRYALEVDPQLFMTGKIVTLGDLVSYIDENAQGKLAAPVV